MAQTYRSRSALLVLLLVGLLPIACGGGDESSVAEGESAFVAMLRVIPDTPDARFRVFINDYRRLREITGAVPPEHGRDVRAVRTYAEELFRLDTPNVIWPLTVFVSGGPRVIGPWTGLEEVLTEQNVGYSFADIELDIQATGLTQQEDHYSAALGAFDPAASARAVQNCPDCVPPDAVDEFRGVTYFSWGADDDLVLFNRWTPPAFDGLGSSSRLAFQPQYVLRTYATQTMREMVAASQGEGSLAANEAFRAAAIALEKEGVYRAFLSDFLYSVEEYGEYLDFAYAGGPEAQNWPPDEALFLLPFEALGIGWILDGFDRKYVAVLVHSSAEAARENGQRFARITAEGTSKFRKVPWSQVIDEVEIEVSGRLVIARVSGYSPMNSVSVLAPDSLFVHE